MGAKEDEIDALLSRIEKDFGIAILYACESGSRAWGFASPDSDYDIRFLFVRPERDYLKVLPEPDAIDLPLQAGDLDAGGWDVRKAAALLGKSNGALVEWLHSPIVYHSAAGFLDRWRSAAREVYSPRASADHYRGMAKQILMGKMAGEQVRAKDYFYALRAVLAASWILQGRGIPPVPFVELLPTAPEDVRKQVTTLLDLKAATLEGDRMDRIAALDEFLQTSFSEIEAQIASMPQHAASREALNALALGEIRAPKPESAADYTLERVRREDVLIFETVAGSHAYGTAINGSDEDRRGVFMAAPGLLLGLDAVDQVADERNDHVYYELGRFVDLLLKNNPNALELLGMPEDCVKHRHPLFARLPPELFLSKLCEKTFGEYAMGQIRKARGLNKKIVNPQPEERHPLLSFCHVPEGQGSVPVLEWLANQGIKHRECCLTAVRNAAGMHAIYHLPGSGARGLVSPKDPDVLIYASVPKEAQPIAWMHCNEDAFKAHCKAHREYWEWVANRNEERFTTNMTHGKGYDSKNLMHTLRLLDMAGEIAREGVLRVRRPNRDFLLRVRSGEFSYDWLVNHAEEQHAGLADLYAASDLPAAPDRERVNALLVSMRAEHG